MISVRIAAPLLASEDSTQLDRLLPLIHAVVPIAVRVKERAQESQFVGRQPQYDSAASGYSVMLSYAWAAGVRTKATRWRSSYAFHAAAGSKPGQGVNSRRNRGMWQGYQVRSYGSDAVVVEFARSSLGASSRRKGKEFVNKKGETKTQRNDQLVPNAMKAFSIWKAWRINLTQMRDGETQALQGAVAYQAQKAVAEAFGFTVRPVWFAAGDVRLYRQIVEQWVR